jgi:hypothetical protein
MYGIFNVCKNAKHKIERFNRNCIENFKRSCIPFKEMQEWVHVYDGKDRYLQK